MMKSGFLVRKLVFLVRIMYLCILKDGSVFPRENTSTVFTENTINHTENLRFLQ